MATVELEVIEGSEASEVIESLAEPGVAKPRPRLKFINRQQLVLRQMDVERLVEPDHPVRAIWELVGRMNLEPFYQSIGAVEGVAGREPFDPQLLISLWIYAYSQKVSSAREMARRCQYDPAYQWLTGLEAINYHTLSDFRVQHQQALDQLFTQVLAVLSQAGWITLQRVMQDGTKIKAQAGDNTFRRQATLERHLQAARQRVREMEELGWEEVSRRVARARERACREKQQRVEEALQQLAQIQAAKSSPLEKAAARASLTDPEARIMVQAKNGFAPSYNVQISTDAQAGLIVGVGVSQAANDEAELEPAVQRLEANLGQVPQQMVVDEGFINQSNVISMDHQQIDLIGPVPDRSAQTEAGLKHRGVSPEFFPSAFVYDATGDCYRCPAGKRLAYEGREQKGQTTRYRYRARPGDCCLCPLKSQCCPGSRKGRSLVRSQDAPAVAAFKAKMETPEAQAIYKQRAGIAEFPNAWIKEKIGLRQFRLRGLAKVTLEALWACLTYNVQHWIRLVWRPQRLTTLAPAS
jgi:transposase